MSRSPGNGGADEDRTEPKSNLGVVTGVALAAAAAAAVGIASTFFGSSSSSSEPTRKTMKAPGKNGETIYRDEFEAGPKAYFQDLHKK